MNELGKGSENLMVGKGLHDGLIHKTSWKIDKWLSDEDFLNGLDPYNTSEFDGNLLVNAGINLVWTLAAGGAGTAYSNANAYIAVGTGTTAAAATDTTLTTESARVAMDASYPTYGSSQQIVFRSTFNGSTANVHWQEFGVLNASSSGTLLNHKVSDQGTKTSGQTWQVTVTITLS